jgi:hypothetical protein
VGEVLFLAAAEKFLCDLRFFLIAFLNSPCYETPKKRDKKNKQHKNNRGRGGGGAHTLFVMSPDVFFGVF